MQELRVSSWSELQDAVFEDAWNQNLRRYRSPFVFRGVSDLRYSLVTSLSRLGGDARELERHLLRAFRKYAHPEIDGHDSYWYWLAAGQHHGLPTRLLDWSYSPLVAMHFATADPRKFGCDGVIWMVDFARTNALLPQELRALLQEEGGGVFTVELLAELSRRSGGEGCWSSAFDVKAIEDIEAKSDEPFLLFLEPPSIDARIAQQYALFSLLSDPLVPLDGWLAKRPGMYRKIILPASLKWEVRDKLDQANVNERTLFPGLSGLSTWLRRYYTPRGEDFEGEDDGGVLREERERQQNPG